MLKGLMNTHRSHEPEIIVPSFAVLREHTFSPCPSRVYRGSGRPDWSAYTLMIESWPPVMT